MTAIALLVYICTRLHNVRHQFSGPFTSRCSVGVHPAPNLYFDPLSSFSTSKILLSVSLMHCSNPIHLMPSSFSTSDESVLKCGEPSDGFASGMRDAWSGKALRAIEAIWVLS